MYRRGHMSYDDEDSQYRIGADRQEEDRLGMEALIRRGIEDISLAPPSTDNEQDYSVEYPRHGPHSPLPFDPYSSFARSQNEYDFVPQEELSAMRHPTTFPTRKSKPAAAFASFGPEDESYGFGGETVSTTGHHRSAVTFNAGLGGLPDSTRDGKEYDPDRRLDRLLDNRPHMSMFDDGTPRTRRAHQGNANRGRQSNKSRDIQVQNFASHPTFDPVIVDDTNEIDRAVEAGHLQFNNIPPIPQSNSRLPRNHPRDDDTISHPESDGTSFRRSEPPSPPARPKLSDALERVADDGPRFGAFSPRRQAFSPVHSPRTRNAAPSTSRALPAPAEQSGANLRKPSKPNAKDVSTRPAQPHAWDEANQRARRHPLLDPANRTADLSVARPKRAATLPNLGTPMGKVQLPDVTGITIAVDTPLKDRLGYLTADPRQQANSKQFNAAVEELAARLREVERENATSRRRVKELERELEECREEVQRERTRLEEELERSRAPSPEDPKGKRRAVAIEPEDGNTTEFWKARYEEVVEQKEALETLVNTLRAHIARMAKELEERQRDLQELRQIRERDALALQSKLHEVEEAHEQVDELAAEVDRLRSIIDEGLRERRRAKEAEEMISRASIHAGELSTVREATNEDEDEDEPQGQGHGGYGYYQYQSKPNRQYSPPAQDQTQDDAQTEPDYDAEEPPKQGVRIAVQEPTLEYTVGDITQPEPETVQLQQQLYGRQRSGSNATTVRSASRLSSRAPSPRFGQVRATQEPVRRAPSRLSALRGEGGRSPEPGDDAATTSSLGRPIPPSSRRFITVSKKEDQCAKNFVDERRLQAAELQRLESDVEDRRSERSMSTNGEGEDDTRNLNQSRANSDPGTTAPGRASKHLHGGRPGSRLARHHSSPPIQRGEALPVPDLRSKQAERLFFGKTNHDESTCTKCHRRRKDRSEAHHEEWLATFLRRRSRTATQDGNVVDVDVDRLPPQTVLARVVRELEDEFTHHKSIYVELAEQYALMDAASNVAKRNVLAEHLREVIDILEQKGDQIASLYDLLAFKDRPVPPKAGRYSPPTTAPVV
ncbi:hypothetical protein FRB90_005880 [Tulasnella sp. 427]|nr:hypothetical protein FRB90_005880 [Tulasnella sp. 427]